MPLSTPPATTASAGANATQDHIRTNVAHDDNIAHGTAAGDNRAVDDGMSAQSLESAAAITVATATTTIIVQPVPNLQHLIPELKLEVLSNLPILQIPKLRETCTTFRELVDEHLDTLSRTRITASLAKLAKFIETNITYSAKTVNGESTFMKALTDFINVRGLVKPGECPESLMLLDWFANNWRRRLALADVAGNAAASGELQEDRQAKDQPDDQSQDDVFEFDPLLGAINGLTQLHFHHHMREYELKADHVIFYQRKWLDSPPQSVGLESQTQMEAVLRDVENGVWAAAKLFPECPVTSCTVDAPASAFGVYATPHWDFGFEDGSEGDYSEGDSDNDTDSSDGESEELGGKLLEEKLRADCAASSLASQSADDEEGWTVVASSRRSRKQVAISDPDFRPEEQDPSDHEDAYRAGLPEAERDSYDDLMNRPILCQTHGIKYDHKSSETLDLKFQRLFEVPKLPQMGTPFQYYVQSAWAYDLVKDTLVGDAELGLQQKAAVLEEVYVY